MKRNAFLSLAIACLLALILAACGSSGGSGGGGGGDGLVTLGTVSALYNTNGAGWNDYVKNDGLDVFSATDTACTGTETGGYSACLHGGETRTFEVTGKTACTGLTAEDSLGAFTWTCDDTSGTAVFISTGLTNGVYLSGLLDFDSPAFRSNQVTVYDTGVAYGETPSTVWWNNPVISNTTGGTLSTAGAIYLVNSNPYAEFVLGADSVGFVVQPGVILNGPSASTHVVSANAQNFLWVEGTIEAGGDYSSLYLQGIKFSVIRNITASKANVGPYGYGVMLTSSSNNMLTDIRTSRTSHHGLYVGTSTYNTIRNVSADGDGWLSEITLSDSSFNTLENISATGSSQVGIYLFRSFDNVLKKVRASNNGSNGIHISTLSGNNVLTDVTSTDNGGDGIALFGTSGNTISNVTCSNNNSDAISLTRQTVSSVVHYSTDNVLTNLTLADNSGGGIWELNGSDNNIFRSVASANNNSMGVYISDSSANTFENIAAAHGTYGYYITNSAGFSDNNYFTGILKTGNHSNADCFVLPAAGTAQGLINSTCTDDGSDGSSSYTGQLSDAVLSGGADLSAAFQGKMITNDTVNGSIQNGDGTAAFANITDWSGFESIYRGWGKDGSAFPSSDNRGRCTTGACRIWDWSMVSTDTALVNSISALPTGDDTLTHTWSGGGSSTFLRNAAEIQGDGIGNDDTLCETDETCLYTPNMGSYQGHGNLINAGSFTDGAISNVTLMKYETNGY